MSQFFENELFIPYVNSGCIINFKFLFRKCLTPHFYFIQYLFVMILLKIAKNSDENSKLVIILVYKVKNMIIFISD
ncbi:hypothetical protein CHH34_04115 [Aeromonas veronii]|nr:hypothetical protein CHF44_05685 [Aeromonas veronii]RDU93612.1 hypothetical protein CHH34_04115 [Aeromonas veronii]TEY67463.1 hypothetical protein CIG15_04260 [Aeromonas veronii]